MTRVWGSIHGARYFIAVGILLLAGVAILGDMRHVCSLNLMRKIQVPSESKAEAPAKIQENEHLVRVPETMIKEAADAEARGRYPEAIGVYEKILAGYPEFLPAYLKLGQVYFRIGLPSKAEEAYLTAIGKGLNDPDVYLYLGYIRESKADLKQALDYYAKAELAGSKNPVLYFNMGNVEAQLGLNDKALGHLKRAVLLFPGYRDAFVNLSIILAQTGEFADAQYFLEKAEKLGYDAPVQFKKELAEKAALK